MKILQVIHGFPPYYMAGSEVYTYNLSKELSKNNEVFVFTRIENPFLKPYTSINEKIEKINIIRINKPNRDYSLLDKYVDYNIDYAYEKYLEETNPDVVHIQHLSHLSTNIPLLTKELGIPIVFTIHDFWMFCIRGQLLLPNYQICGGPNPENCVKCLQYMNVTEEDYFKYREHMKRVLLSIDIFLAPSQFIKNFYEKMGIPENKLVYSPYGFNKNRIKYSKKIYSAGSKINFGFVGRIIPPKGIHLLIESFCRIKNKNGSKLLIYGDTGKYLSYLRNIGCKDVYFMGGFHNDDIDSILDKIDVLVVPSIWYENSPLVIQEAFLKGLPVITSDIGGMKELVNDGKEGFLFKMGDIEDLKEKLEMIINNPQILNMLEPHPSKVRSIEEDASNCMNIYRRLIQ